MRLHSGQNEAVLDWLGRQTEFHLGMGTQLIWATDDLDGRIIGAVGAGGRMGRTFGSLSIAVTDKHVALPLMRAGFGWLFGTMGAAAGYVTISSKKHNWIQQLVKVAGFREVDRVRQGINSREDLVVLKLTAETCRLWQAELKKLVRRPALEVG